MVELGRSFLEGLVVYTNFNVLLKGAEGNLLLVPGNFEGVLVIILAYVECLVGHKNRGGFLG